MKIWILTSDSNNLSSLALKRALSERDHQAEVLNPHHISFQISRNNVDFFYNSAPIEKPKMAIPRLGWSSLEIGLIIASSLESAEVKVVNPTQGYRLAAHKLESILRLHQHGVATPTSRFANLNQDSENFLIGDSTLVFKQFHGSQGFGVTWSEDKYQTLSLIDFFRNSKTSFYSQEMIKESFGKDLRVFVAGSKILGAIERQNKSDLRSNLQQGGSAKPAQISEEIARIAQDCVKHLGLFYAGVDIIISKQGPLVIEVNPAPGFEGISRALNLDIAALLVDELLRAYI